MGSWLGSIISSIIGGAVIGSLARLILPGRQNISLPTTILAGMVAAFAGTLVARIFGFHDTAGFDWWERIIQVVFALVAVTYAARRFPAKANSTGTSSGGTYGATGTGTYGDNGPTIP
jgi:uncharacterized membrane protein YeaQ/YmgE (transglycosylase-associated protein family)